MWEIPYGLGTWSNPVEQPSSAWPTDPETPEPYSSPSQQYVDDLDAFQPAGDVCVFRNIELGS